MYNKEDLLKRLMAGENKDDIAQELADKLNSMAADMSKALNEAVAMKQQEEEQKAHQAQMKLDYADGLAMELSDFISKYYPKLNKHIGNADGQFCTGEDLVELFDACTDLTDTIAGILEQIGDTVGRGKVMTKAFKKPEKSAETDDEKLREFLRQMKLL